MKKFFTVVLGSFVGTWLAMTIASVMSILLSFALIGAMASGSSMSSYGVSDNSILLLDMGMTISERSSEDGDMITMITGEVAPSISIKQLVDGIRAAKTNNDVKGIYIDCNGVSAGVATLRTLRNAIVDFKTSGKFVYAFGYQGIAQADYYVASAADSIFISPYTSVDIHGLAAQNLMFKRLLDKVGIEMQVVRVGTFKSAVEPYLLDQISDANRMQQEHYMGSIWNTMLSDMAKSRKIDASALNALADSVLLAKNHKYILAHKLVDGICYRPEMENKLRKLTVGEDEVLNFVTADQIPLKDTPKNDKEIALVYAAGEIDGNSSGGIDSYELVDAINELAKDDNVAAMVLRVNSPGGSAFGSEQIWKSIEEFKAKGKKVVVSMGDYAASGGYYISCGADYIFADATTITGSIGIFGVIPCAENLVSEKLGVTQNVVSTNANGVMGSLITHLTPEQYAAMQQYVNDGYELFTSRCATGRHMNINDLKKIAEGRVWDGKTAIELGLVDQLGSLNDAMSKAAAMASVKDGYKVGVYPKVKSSWEKFLTEYASAKYEEKMYSQFGELYDYQKVLSRVLGRDKVLCIMEPSEIKM